MNDRRTVLAQLLDLLPNHEFSQAVRRYGGDRRVRTLSCRDQFLAMAFAQLAGRDSLRDVVACLDILGPRLYHAGFRGRVARSTLAEANEQRDWRIYADVAQVLIAQARQLYAGDHLSVELDAAAYALDSTVIRLCLSLCPWAHAGPGHAAVKMHTLLSLRGSIPAFVCVTGARVADVTMLDQMPLEAGAFYVMDRGYVDFTRMARIDAAGAFFVVRSKSNIRLRRMATRPPDAHIGLFGDHLVRPATAEALRHYPGRLRRVRYYDAIHDNDLVLLTNNTTIEGLTVADLYRLRWQVETFFRWIKQHLRIKTFYGTSDNAARTQIWIALIAYLLVALAKKHLKIETPLATMLQILSVCLFERMPLVTALTQTPHHQNDTLQRKQLDLFDF